MCHHPFGITGPIPLINPDPGSGGCPGSWQPARWYRSAPRTACRTWGGSPSARSAAGFRRLGRPAAALPPSADPGRSLDGNPGAKQGDGVAGVFVGIGDSVPAPPPAPTGSAAHQATGTDRSRRPFCRASQAAVRGAPGRPEPAAAGDRQDRWSRPCPDFGGTGLWCIRTRCSFRCFRAQHLAGPGSSCRPAPVASRTATPRT